MVRETFAPILYAVRYRTLEEAMKGADVFIGVSLAGLVSAVMGQGMAGNPIIFALANPNPALSDAEPLYVAVLADRHPVDVLHHEKGNTVVGYAAVDETRELVDMMETARGYQNNVEVMNTAKTLLMKTLQMGQ